MLLIIWEKKRNERRIKTSVSKQEQSQLPEQPSERWPNSSPSLPLPLPHSSLSSFWFSLDFETRTRSSRTGTQFWCAEALRDSLIHPSASETHLPLLGKAQSPLLRLSRPSLNAFSSPNFSSFDLPSQATVDLHRRWKVTVLDPQPEDALHLWICGQLRFITGFNSGVWFLLKRTGLEETHCTVSTTQEPGGRRQVPLFQCLVGR